MTIFRRTFLLWLLMLWQGGFLFYGAIVVPIGAHVLGSDSAQGFITRIVTNALNIVGAITLFFWLWDLLADRASRLKARWICWAIMAGSLVAMAFIHVAMDGLLDLERERILDRPSFRSHHRWYLRVTTLQWLAAVVFTVFSLLGWRDSDQANLVNDGVLAGRERSADPLVGDGPATK